jgi:hypothetical protein
MPRGLKDRHALHVVGHRKHVETMPTAPPPVLAPVEPYATHLQRLAEQGIRQWPVTETGDSADYWQSTASPRFPTAAEATNPGRHC